MDHPLPATAAGTGHGTLRDRLLRRLQALIGRPSWRDRPLTELLGIDRNVLWQALQVFGVPIVAVRSGRGTRKLWSWRT